MYEIPSCPGYFITINGLVYSTRQGKFKLLQIYTRPCGYKIVSVRVNNKSFKRYLHRLLAEVYLGGFSYSSHVNHIDGNKSNNTIHNIELSDPKHNARHAASLGLLYRGISHVNAKLTEEEVMEIRSKCVKATQRELAKIYGVSRQLISGIKLGKIWKHI